MSCGWETLCEASNGISKRSYGYPKLNLSRFLRDFTGWMRKKPRISLVLRMAKPVSANTVFPPRRKPSGVKSGRSPQCGLPGMKLANWPPNLGPISFRKVSVPENVDVQKQTQIFGKRWWILEECEGNKLQLLECPWKVWITLRNHRLYFKNIFKPPTSNK